MQTVHSALPFVLYWCLVISIIALVATLLMSLTKKGDERKTYIKTKAMASSFMVLVGVLLLNVIWTTFRMSIGRTGSSYPFVYLFIVSLVFLIYLIINKKKHGD